MVGKSLAGSGSVAWGPGALTETPVDLEASWPLSVCRALSGPPAASPQWHLASSILRRADGLSKPNDQGVQPGRGGYLRRPRREAASVDGGRSVSGMAEPGDPPKKEAAGRGDRGTLRQRPPIPGACTLEITGRSTCK